MTSLLRLVPLWAYALAAALGWGAWQKHQATQAGQRAVAAQQALADIRADAAQLAIDTLARNVAAQQEAVNEAHEIAAAHRAGADAAADALRRLRHRATASAGACASPAASDRSAAAPGAAAVPAELFDRLGAVAGQLAAIADERGRAGAACERIGAVAP